jgi:hypothetical protein
LRNTLGIPCEQLEEMSFEAKQARIGRVHAVPHAILKCR